MLDTTSEAKVVLTMTKPLKPTSDYPLFAHNNGQWAKKIKGKLRYFGPWDDPQGALARYLVQDTQASTGRHARSKPKYRLRPAGQATKDYPLYAHAIWPVGEEGAGCHPLLWPVG